MSRLIQIQFVNESSVFQHSDLETIIAALQKQVYQDFRPTWGVTAELVVLPQGHKPANDKCWMGIFDNSDQAGALGYHDLTPLGFPVGKVFAKTDIEVGAKSSVTIGHETLEMLGDPFINLTALDPKTGRLYAYENCDAVEADEIGYLIDGVTVSDFVLPQWFDPSHRGKDTPTTIRALRNDGSPNPGEALEPFELAAGGYISYLDLAHPNKGWQQETHEEKAVGARMEGFPAGSRRERRIRASEGKLQVSSIS